MSERKLQYIGPDGRYIVNVPARDLTALDLENLAAAQFNTLDYAATVPDVIGVLVGCGLYALVSPTFVCDDCGKEYKTYDGYHNHVLSAHIQDEKESEDDESEV